MSFRKNQKQLIRTRPPVIGDTVMGAHHYIDYVGTVVGVTKLQSEPGFPNDMAPRLKILWFLSINPRFQHSIPCVFDYSEHSIIIFEDWEKNFGSFKKYMERFD